MRGDPQALGAQCHACPLAVDGKPCKPVLADIPANPTAILVGESPGEEEQRCGLNFKGDTGKKLDRELEDAGLVRGRMVVVNAIACMPPQMGKTESLMNAAFKACFPAFQRQVSRFRGLPIIAMGKWAWRAVAHLDNGAKLPKGGLNKGRGFLRDHRTMATRYIATWHPTYALSRNPYEWGAFSVDLRRFGRLLTNTLRPGPEALITDPTEEDIYSVVHEGRVAVDVESAPRVPEERWTGKDPLRARLRTIGLGNARWGLSFEANEANEHLVRAARRVVHDSVVVTQNGPWFDQRLLERNGFIIRRLVDTMHMRKALVVTSPASLAYLASLYDDAVPWKELGLNPLDVADDEPEDLEEDSEAPDDPYRGQEDDDKGLVFTRNMEDLKKYNAQDCVETARAHDAMAKDPKWQDPKWQRIYQMRMAVAQQAAELHTNGIWMDPVERAALDRELAESHAERKETLLKLVNHPAFRAVPDDLRALLFRRHGSDKLRRFDLPDPHPKDKVAWTKTGLAAVNQDALLLLITNPLVPPEAKKIIRQWWMTTAPAKARSTFVVSALVDQATGDDGRLRPETSACMADTFRSLTKRPNISCLSKEKD